MNLRLIKMYVARKAAMHNEAFAEMERKMTRKDFTASVMKSSLKEIPESLRKDLSDCIRKKYGLPQHVPLTSKAKMTIGQWVRDLCLSWTIDDIMLFFEQQTNLSVSRLKDVNIHSTAITRPHLITMIEHLEELTGRSLLKMELHDPISYLPEGVTIYGIAKYFVASPEVIERLHRRYGKTRQVKNSMRTLKQKALGLFRNVAGIAPEISDKEVLSRSLSSFWWHEFTPADWDLVVYFTAEEFGVILPLPLLPDMTVESLLDLMVRIKLKS